MKMFLKRFVAEENEPLFRFIEISVVVLSGLFITTFFSCQQLRVAEKQIEVADKQLKLSLASTIPEANIIFKRSGRIGGGSLATGQLVVDFLREDVKDVKIRCELFIEERIDNSTVKTLGITDYFTMWGQTENTAYFDTNGYADIAALNNFRKETHPDNSTQTMRHDSRKAKLYVKVDYVNALGEAATAKYVSSYPFIDKHKVSEKPNYDERIFMSGYKLTSTYTLPPFIDDIDKMLNAKK